jgi:hypothetical protein
LTHKKTHTIAALYCALKTNSRGGSALLQAPRSPFADTAGIRALLPRAQYTSGGGGTKSGAWS